MTNGVTPKIAYLTAGAAGMYCGSCMRDNTLAAALTRLGCDIQLIPTYTPVRTDEESVAVDRVFMGGINVFLQEKVPLFRWLPRFMDRWLDHPALISWLASRGMKTQARDLGALTLSMLKGEQGHQRKEVLRLVDWLTHELQPQLLNYSNILIAGSAPALKKHLNIPILVTLQGDDLFLRDLVEPYQARALEQIRQLAPAIDGFVVFSQYYADFMSDWLGLPKAKFHQVPLGINTRDFSTPEPNTLDHPPPEERVPTLGYFARICPAKGFHLLVEAFLRLRKLPGLKCLRLVSAGWLGENDKEYFEEQRKILDDAGAGPFFHYAGAVDRPGKVAFLRQLDVLSVPTTYQEPKGLFVLEALACSVPVVQPAHGAFPELLAATGGGRLFQPNDVDDLVNTLYPLLTDAPTRHGLGRAGFSNVMQNFNAENMAARTLELYRRFF